VEVSFDGSQGDFQFSSLNGNNYVGLSVDGGPITRAMVQTGVAISFGPLTSGTHAVRVTKLNEGRLGEVTFDGYTTDGAATAVKIPTRRLEFIGDSITAAYGIDGNAPCTNTAALEDATASYAMLAAAALNSDTSLIVVAGKGLLRNDVTDTSASPVTMTSYWQRYVAADVSSQYTFPATQAPDAVIVALGTNDYEYTAPDALGNPNAVRPAIDHAAFVSSYVAFLQQVQSRYPQAKFILCSSPMLSDSYPSAADQQHTALLNDLNAVAQQMNSGLAYVVDFPSLTAGQATGCGNHPNASAHQAMAEQLTQQLKETLSW
jgi:lysophospholipase L1-like esterase